MVAVLRDKKIIAAAAGVSHSVFLDSKGVLWSAHACPCASQADPLGAVYTCGSGKGILGHNDTRMYTVPMKIQALEVGQWYDYISKQLIVLLITTNFAGCKDCSSNCWSNNVNICGPRWYCILVWRGHGYEGGECLVSLLTNLLVKPPFYSSFWFGFFHNDGSCTCNCLR